jgi:non-specific protein-tyrosine kinase
LRSNIGFAEVDKPLRFLMVTSTFAKEGKSTVAANLALMMAHAGKSTLLIDADLRHPTLHEQFGLAPDKQGLSNAILTCSVSLPVFTPLQFQSLLSPVKNVGVVPLHNFIHAVGIPNLGVMPSGPLPPNPSELLSSKAMQRFFSSLKSCGAEVIIFDTVSLLGLADACELASKVDGTIVVVDTLRSRKTGLLQAKTMLSTAGAHVIGCVLNQQPRTLNQQPRTLNQQPRTFKKVTPAFSALTALAADALDEDAGEGQDHFGMTDGIAPVVMDEFR